jgi:hypothetical protein
MNSKCLKNNFVLPFDLTLSPRPFGHPSFPLPWERERGERGERVRSKCPAQNWRLSSLILAAVIALSPLSVLAQQHTDSLTATSAENHIKPDSLIVPRGSDSLRAGATSDSASLKPRNDSLKHSVIDSKAKTGVAALPFSGAPPEDTTYHFWEHPYWGFGAGWGLGSFPLFKEWIKGLPDSASDLAGKSSQVPKFSILEPPNAYYIVWPVLLSFTPFSNERRSISIESAAYFLFLGKSFIASLKNDSLPVQAVTWNQSCDAYFFTIGLTYRHVIPPDYFKVEGAQRTSAVLGLSVTPLMHFSESSSFSAAGIADSTLTKLQTNVDNRSFNGMGCSWKIGVSTLKKLSPRSGLEIDLVYIGRINGYFKNNGGRMLWKDVNPGSETPRQNVSFLSSTFEIDISLETGKSGPAVRESSTTPLPLKNLP